MWHEVKTHYIDTYKFSMLLGLYMNVKIAPDIEHTLSYTKVIYNHRAFEVYFKIHTPHVQRSIIIQSVSNQ